VVVLGVLFEPGARTDWHSHPGGQTLFVDSGSGIVVNDAGAVVEVGPGDAVAIPPGETHWHGATESSYMMHISITAGGPTSWNGQKVSEEQYRSVRGG
jgi:quercetin dioxygenase-like cupin family protein